MVKYQTNSQFHRLFLLKIIFQAVKIVFFFFRLKTIQTIKVIKTSLKLVDWLKLKCKRFDIKTQLLF